MAWAHAADAANAVESSLKALPNPETENAVSEKGPLLERSGTASGRGVEGPELALHALRGHPFVTVSLKYEAGSSKLFDTYHHLNRKRLLSVNILLMMKQTERLDLVSDIGRELQSRYTFDDIEVFLSPFGLELPDKHSFTSKWVYVKNALAEATEETIIRIADELEMDHPYVLSQEQGAVESKFWETSHLRLFLSHVSDFKVTTAHLRNALKPYGISGFVAHSDIEPTKEWQSEIEVALHSMDALAAILTDGFSQSEWTDQEVGAAVGRGVLVIPVMRGVTPHGFMRKYQGLWAEDKTVGEVAEEIFEVLVASGRTRSRMLRCLIDTIVMAGSNDLVKRKISILQRLEDIPRSYLERLRDSISDSATIPENATLLAMVNTLLEDHGLAPVSELSGEEEALTGEDDLPF